MTVVAIQLDASYNVFVVVVVGVVVVFGVGLVGVVGGGGDGHHDSLWLCHATATQVAKPPRLSRLEPWV